MTPRGKFVSTLRCSLRSGRNVVALMPLALLLALVLATVMPLSNASATPARMLNYSCVGTVKFPDHCYGTAQTTFSDSYNGQPKELQLGFRLYPWGVLHVMDSSTTKCG